MESTDRSKLFREFPLSVRIAQRSWITAMAIPLFSFRLAKMKIQWLVPAITAVTGLFALIGFVATCWVVVRYPYIGLVDAADGDVYSKYVEKSSMFLKKLLGVTLAIGLAMALYIPFHDGKLTGVELLWLLYFGAVLIFLLFVMFKFNRFDHPAVATLLRCSLGLGIPLFPLLLPALIVGSGRAKRLLAEAQEQLTS